VQDQPGVCQEAIQGTVPAILQGRGRLEIDFSVGVPGGLRQQLMNGFLSLVLLHHEVDEAIGEGAIQFPFLLEVVLRQVEHSRQTGTKDLVVQDRLVKCVPEAGPRHALGFGPLLVDVEGFKIGLIPERKEGRQRLIRPPQLQKNPS